MHKTTMDVAAVVVVMVLGVVANACLILGGQWYMVPWASWVFWQLFETLDDKATG